MSRKVSGLSPLLPIAIFLAGPLVAVLAGCQSPAAGKLTGTWRLQQPGQISGDSLPGDADTNPDDAAVRNRTESLYDGVAYGDTAGNMILEFHSSGLLETVSDFPAARSRKSWQWSVESWDAQARTAVIECRMPGETVQTTVVFLDDNTIELVPPNIHVLDMRLRFERQ